MSILKKIDGSGTRYNKSYNYELIKNFIEGVMLILIEFDEKIVLAIKLSGTCYHLKRLYAPKYKESYVGDYIICEVEKEVFDRRIFLEEVWLQLIAVTYLTPDKYEFIRDT